MHRKASQRWKMFGLFLTMSFVLSGSIVHADNTMSLTNAIGAPGDTVELTVLATNDDEIQGFSIAVAFDELTLAAVGTTFDGTVTEATVGGLPEFVGIDIEPNSMVTGVILELSPTTVISIPASPNDPEPLARLQFTIDPGVIPSGDVSIVELGSEVGSPPVATHLSSFGATILPTLTDGSITIESEFRFSVPDLTVVAGSFAFATVVADHGLDLNGFQISMVWDNSQIVVSEPPAGWTAGLDAGGVTIDFFNPILVPALPIPNQGTGSLAISAIFDALPPFDGDVLPASPDSSLINLGIDVDPGLQIGDCITLDFENQVPGLLLDNVLVVLDGQAALPILEDPQVCVGAPADFRRGDTNTDGSVNIADAIFLLEFLFSLGNPPLCAPAADANDDEVANIADAVSILGFLFSGDPPPPPPGESNCGPDPTPGPACGSYPPAC